MKHLNGGHWLRGRTFAGEPFFSAQEQSRHGGDPTR
jgi:hypothetical protein